MKINLKSLSKTDIRNAGNAYNAIFKVEGLEKLIRPSVEINNSQHINMWRNCFDQNGRFNRSKFNQYRREFENWENAFSMIWLDMKSVSHQEDRTAILNSLVRMAESSDQLHQYIEFILKDFFYYPLHLHYSDINSLIFANIFIFKHYSTQSHDFEITPEEVLISKEEKNIQLIERLSSLIESSWGDRLIEKIKTIKKNLYLSLEPQKEGAAQLPPEKLIQLLREVFIFLTLVGGRSVYKVLRDTVEELSDPESKLFTSRHSRKYLKNIMRLMLLSVRCLILLGDEDDIEVLEPIPMREKGFITLDGVTSEEMPFHNKMVQAIITVAEEGMSIMGKKGKHFKPNMKDDELSDALKRTFVLE